MSSRALMSVSDKTGLDTFAPGLVELGFELVASGGTAAHLEELGVPVQRVEDLTDVPELLGGRVKTLHPRIHAAILARPDQEADRADLDGQGIRPFDLVCVNLYPFARALTREVVNEEEALELIDIGGSALLRAAAKNFAHVVPVCLPSQYDHVLDALRTKGRVSGDLRRQLAADAFSTTAAHEASIAGWLNQQDPFPEIFVPAFTKVLDLAYGENPHQRAAFYADIGVRRHLLSMVEQLHGRTLSLINLYDLSAGRLLLREFEEPACVIVKHATPSGVGTGKTLDEAYGRALASDPMSAFGMVCVLNRPVDAELGTRLSQQFVDVLFAPGYDDEAVQALRAKPATRVLVDRERRRFNPEEKDYKRVLGGLLVQDRDWLIEDRDEMEVVCGSPTEEQWHDLLFAWRIAKHVGSNGIVIARDGGTIGIGAGQQSRVDAVRLALEKARQHEHDLSGSSLASDAFFPFPDGPASAVAAGVRAIIQPGGSKRDDEVVRAVEQAGAAMVFTSRRHFRH